MGESDQNESKFFALADRTLQRMTSKDEREEVDDAPREKVFKSPMAKHGPLLPLQNGVMRGSFLARDADALSRLEKFNKHKEEKEVVQDGEVEEEKEKGKKVAQSKGPMPKKQK